MSVINYLIVVIKFYAYTNYLCRISSHKTMIRNIFCYNRSCANKTMIPNF